MSKTLTIISLALGALLALPTLAEADNGNHSGWAKNGKGGDTKGAPAPIAGAGLPVLLVLGGYALVRRYRTRT